MYTFIKTRKGFDYEIDYENKVNVIFVTTNEIKEMLGSETYNNYGHLISDKTNGNYLTLLTQKAVDIANKKANEIRKEEHDLATDWDEESNDYIVKDFYSLQDTISADEKIYDCVISECDEADYEVEGQTVEGFNYWDGNNWRTIAVYREDYDYYEYEAVEQEEEIKKFNTILEEMEFYSEGYGTKIYESKNYWILQSFWNTNPWTYEIYSKDEFNLGDIWHQR